MKVFFFAFTIFAVGFSHALQHDSPEVESAKAAHFEAVQRAEAVIANAPPVDRKENVSAIPETSQHQLGVTVQDTPEVAAAKVTHFEAVREAELATAEANATNRHNLDVHEHHSSPAYHSGPVHYPTHGHIHSSGHHSYYPSHAHHSAPVYRPEHGYYDPPHQHHYVSDYHHYPYSAPIVQTTQHKLGVNVQDTPEVVAAKVAHYNAVRQSLQAAAAVPVPTVVVSASVSDTPEVAAAKAAHFEAVRRAQAGQYVPLTQRISYIPIVYSPRKVVTIPQTNQHKLGVNVQDTPEVAAAKVAHFAAFRQAEIAAAEGDEVKTVPNKNVYSNTARQYGQVQ